MGHGDWTGKGTGGTPEGNRFDFYLTGLYGEPKAVQLKNFSLSLAEAAGRKTVRPRTWLDAFDQLKGHIQSLQKEKVVVFIDEIPWLDTPHSGFLAAFEQFWNGWGSARDNLLVVICGSATSWIVRKIFRNKGGLYNRVTRRMYLEPFTLRETEQYLLSRGIEWSRYDIAECYMVMGGIPYYLRQIDRDLSYVNNIDAIFFRRDGKLSGEFGLLYDTLFNSSRSYVQIVEAVGTRKGGLTRQEILEQTGLPDNGRTSRMLEDLHACRILRKSNAFGKVKKEVVYQLADYYSLFYLRFLRDKPGVDGHFWSNTLDSPSRRAWAGYSFEQLCKDHIAEIKKRLGISGILTQTASWSGSDGTGRAQIDLLIDRRDRVIDLCEMKFSIGEFTIDREYDLKLRNKMSVFRNATGTRKALHIVMVTTYGLKRNAYSGIAQKEVVLDHLFESRD